MSQDEFAQNNPQQDMAQLLDTINQRLVVLEGKDNVTSQRFDRLEQQVVRLTTDMTSNMDRIVSLLSQLQPAQVQAQPQTEPAATQEAQPEVQPQAQPLVPTVQAIPAPSAPDPLAIAAAAQARAANNCSGGCGGSGSSELIDFAVDTAKVVGVAAAIGIGGYAAFKGGQWLIGQISNWTK